MIRLVIACIALLAMALGCGSELKVDVSSVFRSAAPQVITFASPSSANALVSSTPEDLLAQVLAIPATAVGETTAEALREAGFQSITVAESTHTEALVIAVARACEQRV